MFDLHHGDSCPKAKPKAKGKAKALGLGSSLGLGDILTVSILIGGCVFYSPSLCVPPFCRGAM